MDKRIDIAEVAQTDVLALQDELGCSVVMAQVLARRGFSDPVAAKAFLSSAERHVPALFGGMDAAVAEVNRAIADRLRITVHGDYDADGVCSTAILVGALREMGADVDWFIPSRSEDGYGLSARTVEILSERGTALLITVDCGITAVEETSLARSRGMRVVITDHHAPRPDGALPDAPIVHPVVGGYPCEQLCGAGVAHKLVEALAGSARADRDLDVVALATIADCVPLIGENRRLVREGLRAIANTQRPGLRALMRSAEVDPSRVDATAVSFRLAPRINAAGRVHRADAGVELLLTSDPERAATISEQLEQRNSERRHTEQRIRFEAEAQVAQVDPAGDRRTLVIAGDDWHPGVIGIVASRIVERHNRPVVVVAFDGDTGTASGRSIPGFDLLAGLTAAGTHLERFGGHRAAAGATIRRDRLEAFREAFEAHARAVLTDDDLIGRQRADAVVSGDELGTELAEELSQIGPFGVGNPEIGLLVPAARVSDLKTMGEGKHLRFGIESGGVRARAVAFGTTVLPDAELLDAVFTLELNEFRGAVEPRLLLRACRVTDPGPIEILEPTTATGDAPRAISDRVAPRPIDRRGYGLAGTIGALVATGEPVVVVCTDTAIRHAHLRGRHGSFALTSWGALRAQPDLVDRFAHLVALDPPPHPDMLAVAFRPLVHLAWGAEELRFAHGLLAGRDAPRASLATLFRSLRSGGLDSVDMPGWQARELLGVLVELGIATEGGEVLDVTGKRELESSARYRALDERHQEGLQWLSSAISRAA